MVLEENLRNKEEKGSLDGTWIQRFPVVKKDELDFSKRRREHSNEKGKQNIRRRVPQKPDIVEKLYWMRSQNKI